MFLKLTSICRLLIDYIHVDIGWIEIKSDLNLKNKVSR